MATFSTQTEYDALAEKTAAGTAGCFIDLTKVSTSHSYVMRGASDNSFWPTKYCDPVPSVQDIYGVFTETGCIEGVESGETPDLSMTCCEVVLT